jgi:hypothetical protein
VKVRTLLSLAAASGLAIPAAISAAEPAPLPIAAATANPNQQLADAVAHRLAGEAATARVGISAQDGVVTLSGTAKDAAQKDRMIAAVRNLTGVAIVRDGITIPTSDVIQVGQPPIAAPVAPTPLPPNMGPIVEPAPLGVPGAITPDLQAPPLPPYAWPTYAPHNNLSRVGYPQAYPYNAFPFIGPYYPFPKVPLGWRKVTLEWSDGHWYLGRNSAPHDYWRVKFQ